MQRISTSHRRTPPVPNTSYLAEMHNVFTAGQRPSIDKPDHVGDSKRDIDEHIFQIFMGGQLSVMHSWPRR